MTSTMLTTTSVLAGRAKQRHSNPSANMALRLLQWNANGILAHCQEFQQLLATHNFDIICIQQSFLKPEKATVQQDTTVFGATDQQLKVVSSLSSVMDSSIQFSPSGGYGMPGRQHQNVVGNDHRYQRLCTTDTRRRTSSVRRPIPTEQQHHSRRHECQKPAMAKQHKRHQRKSVGRRNYRARLRRPQHRSRDISDI